MLLGLSSTKICSASPAPIARELCLGSNGETECFVQNESVTSLLPPPLDRLQLWLILGDGVNQAADLALGATSIPSWNLTPWMTFGNWF